MFRPLISLSWAALRLHFYAQVCSRGRGLARGVDRAGHVKTLGKHDAQTTFRLWQPVARLALLKMACENWLAENGLRKAGHHGVGDVIMILIRGGTVVNHDHSWRADVLVDGDKIVAFGSLPRRAHRHRGDRCRRLLRDAGRHRPAYPSRTRLHGQRLRRRFRMGHQGGAGRRHHHGRGLLHSRSRAIDAGGVSGLAPQIREGGVRLRLPHGGDVMVETGVRRDGDRRQNLRHQHLQALHGLQGRVDGQ